MRRSSTTPLPVATALLSLVGALAACDADDKDVREMTPTTGPVHTNRLINATSPYLLQHAHNPVDWYEWGPAALEKARKEDRPIFLSIGYSACHWCHVMAHESFEKEEIAAVMNRLFVNIKVDREERPDLDEIYMQATIAYSGQGGWPMSVWLTPDLKPFVAGTYFPPEGRYGRIGFKELCERIGEVWQTRRADLESDAEQITRAVNARLTGAAAGEAAWTLADVDATVDLLAQAFDPVRGGIASGSTNKFPPSLALDLMLRSAVRNRDDGRRRDRLLNLVQLTLDQMAAGGIYDHLGGGFHRYSTDVEWLVPHFEKMLYDQALLSRLYVDAYQYTRHAPYARIARETFDYVLSDLQAPDGGFYSTRDADSAGEEGKCYVWTRDEIVAALGPDDAALFCSYYDVSDAGNWRDPHAPDERPKNILHVPKDLETVARLHKLEPEELERRLAAGRQKLRAIRSQRVPPHRDEKSLCEWNGMMISSLARGGCVLNEQRYIDAARRAADFILEKQYRGGRLLRSYRDGRTVELAFLTDYAWLIEGLLELYEATFERRWLDRAVELNNVLTQEYWDAERGGYFFTAAGHAQPITRIKDSRDGATPAGNSVQLMNLLRLAVMLGDESLRGMAQRTMSAFAAELKGTPGAGERFLSGVDFALSGPVELAVVGNPADPRARALLDKIYATYLPNRVLMLSNPAADAAGQIKSPLLENRGLVDGQPAVYVCRDYTCQLPVTTPEALAEQLRGR